MLLKKFLLENKIINFFCLFFIFIHLYFWDLQNIINASGKIDIQVGFLRYLILFSLIKLFFFYKNILDQNLILLFLIFLSQIIINFFFYYQIVNLKEIGSIFFFVLLYNVVKIEKNNILRFLRHFFEIFIFFNLLGVVIFIILDKIKIGAACNFFLIDSVIFHENSHFAMMATCMISYYLYSEKNLRNLLFFFILLILSFLYLSLSFLIGMLFALFICLLINLIHKEKKNPIVIIFILLLASVIFFKNNCTKRLDYLLKKTEFDMTSKVSDEVKYEKLLPSRNLSSQVYNIAILNTVYTVKNKLFGWGFNSYQRVYDTNIMNIMMKYYKTEYEQNILGQNNYELIKTNTNDARSVLLKIINEFGLFSLIFIIVGLRFLFNLNVDVKYKSTIITLLITQLISGAGYFNGGFSIFLFMMMLLSNYKKKKIKI